MNLNYFRTFSIVMEAGSFSAAARQLGLTQPAVSMHIQAVEDYFGTKLVERSSKGLELTRAGELAALNVTHLLEGVDSTRKQIDEMMGDVAGPVFLGASTVPGDQLCPALIRAFIERYPRVKPRLIVDSTNIIIDKINKRELDIGIVGAQPKDPTVQAEEIFGDEIILLVNPHHPFATLKEVTPEQLYGEPFVGRASGSGSRSVYERELTAAGLLPSRLTPVLEVGTSLAAVNAVEAGLGIALVSIYAAQKSLLLGTATAVRLAGLNLSRPFFLITVPQRYGGRAVTELANFLRSTEAAQLVAGRKHR